MVGNRVNTVERDKEKNLNIFHSLGLAYLFTATTANTEVTRSSMEYVLIG